MSASILQMNLSGLQQYRQTLVEFKKRERHRREVLAERIQTAESELHDHNRTGDIVDFQIELVDARMEQLKTPSAEQASE